MLVAPNAIVLVICLFTRLQFSWAVDELIFCQLTFHEERSTTIPFTRPDRDWEELVFISVHHVLLINLSHNLWILIQELLLYFLPGDCTVRFIFCEENFITQWNFFPNTEQLRSVLKFLFDAILIFHVYQFIAVFLVKHIAIILQSQNTSIIFDTVAFLK